MKICLVGNRAKRAVSTYEKYKNIENPIEIQGPLDDMDNLREFKSNLRKVNDGLVITSCDDDASIPYLKDIGFSFIEIGSKEQLPKYKCTFIPYSCLEHIMMQKLEIAIEKIRNPIIDCLICGDDNKNPVLPSELSRNLLRLQENGISRLSVYPGDMEKIESILEATYLFDVEVMEISASEVNEKMETGGLICADNNLNTYWDFGLKKKMDFNTYIMLKPDALIKNKFEKVLEEIYGSGFQIEGFIPFVNFVENAMKLYYLKPKPYDSLVRKHLEMSVEIFDDMGMILMLSKAISYVNQMKETLWLKERIRKLSFTFGCNGGIGEYGKESTFQLNMAHCPDTGLYNYRKDMEIISSFGTLYNFDKTEAMKYLI